MYEMSNLLHRYIDAAIQTLVFMITQQTLLTAESNLQSQPKVHFLNFCVCVCVVRGYVQRCRRACVEVREQKVDSLLLPCVSW